jgi:membrane protein
MVPEDEEAQVLQAVRARVAAAWRRTLWEDTRLPAALRAQLRAWDRAVRSLRAEQIRLRAGALTFRTLLSLVPLLAVTFSLFRSFGGLDNAQRALERRLIQNLAPGAAQAVSVQIGTFLDRIASGAVSGLGVLVLLFTVIAVLTAIEESFNALWEVARPRAFMQRFVTYWAMVTVGPVLFALSFSVTSAARSHRAVVAVSEAIPGAGGLLFAIFSVVPWLITCVAMTLLYVVVPHARVKWQAAVGGGLTAGTLWELGKLAFTWASSNLFSYDAIYGGFAALAVLLVWLNVGWVIILLGCKVAYALQHEQALFEQRAAARPLEHAERERLALRCMIAVARAFAAGEPPPTAEQLAAGARVLELRREVLNRLEQRRLLVALDPSPEEERGRPGGPEGYLPGRALASITVKDVFDAFRHPAADDLPAPLREEPVDTLVRDLAARYERAIENGFGALTLAEVVESSKGGRAPA